MPDLRQGQVQQLVRGDDVVQLDFADRRLALTLLITSWSMCASAVGLTFSVRSRQPRSRWNAFGLGVATAVDALADDVRNRRAGQGQIVERHLAERRGVAVDLGRW